MQQVRASSMGGHPGHIHRNTVGRLRQAARTPVLLRHARDCLTMPNARPPYESPSLVGPAVGLRSPRVPSALALDAQTRVRIMDTPGDPSPPPAPLSSSKWEMVCARMCMVFGCTYERQPVHVHYWEYNNLKCIVCHRQAVVC